VSSLQFPQQPRIVLDTYVLSFCSELVSVQSEYNEQYECNRSCVPIRHHLNPSSYIISTTLVVLRSGPPLSHHVWLGEELEISIIVMTPTKSRVGPSSGSVTLKKRRIGPAPSPPISAAS